MQVILIKENHLSTIKKKKKSVNIVILKLLNDEIKMAFILLNDITEFIVKKKSDYFANLLLKMLNHQKL